MVGQEASQNLELGKLMQVTSDNNAVTHGFFEEDHRKS